MSFTNGSEIGLKLSGEFFIEEEADKVETEFHNFDHRITQ